MWHYLVPIPDPKQEIKIVISRFLLRPNRNDINSIQELGSPSFKLDDRLNTDNVVVAGDFNALTSNGTTLKQQQIVSSFMND